MPGVRFLIVGDGELRDQLRASPEALALGERVIWAGFRRDMPAVCFASDVVVQTSDNEGTPVSLIEAQAAGVPVVSTRVGGTPSVVIDGETGALVDPDDTNGFAKQLKLLLADQRTRARLGAAGRARTAERFTLELLVERMGGFTRPWEHRARRREMASQAARSPPRRQCLRPDQCTWMASEHRLSIQPRDAKWTLAPAGCVSDACPTPIPFSATPGGSTTTS